MEQALEEGRPRSGSGRGERRTTTEVSSRWRGMRERGRRRAKRGALSCCGSRIFPPPTASIQPKAAGLLRARGSPSPPPLAPLIGSRASQAGLRAALLEGSGEEGRVGGGWPLSSEVRASSPPPLPKPCYPGLHHRNTLDATPLPLPSTSFYLPVTFPLPFPSLAGLLCK